MFEHMDSLNTPDLVRYAQAAGISDTAEFTACLRDIAMVEGVMQEKVLSGRLGVSGTPVIILQGKVYEGIPRDLDALLRGAMQRDGVTP